MEPWYHNTDEQAKPLTEEMFKQYIRNCFSFYDTSSVEVKLDGVIREAT